MGGGVFFVKKQTFPQRRVHYVQYQYFFYILCTPLPTGLYVHLYFVSSLVTLC